MAERGMLTIDRLPLFADDEQIGEAVLGRERAKEFVAYAAVAKGFPPKSERWGLRYVPAVKRYLDAQQGLPDAKPPLMEDGPEGPWLRPARKAQG